MKPISYDNYYQQNGLIRLRAGISEDWEDAYANMFDSKARFLLQEKIELPSVPEIVQEQAKELAENERKILHDINKEQSSAYARTVKDLRFTRVNITFARRYFKGNEG